MRLKDARQKRGFTQQELASKAGLTQAAIAHIENGKRNYSVSSLKRLAEALQVSPNSLLADA
jgi:transcriptional regulator with XRE-family HTH domain